MKYILFVMFPLFFLQPVLAGKDFEQMEKYVARDKVIIRFQQGISNNSRKKLFEKQPWLKDYEQCLVLKHPDVVIAKIKKGIKTYKALKALMTIIQSLPEINYVNPVLRHDKTEVGMLQDVFVKLKGKQDLEKLKKLCLEKGAVIVRKKELMGNVFVVQNTRPDQNTFELALSLRSTAVFEYVEPDYLFSPIVTSSDPLFIRQWNLDNTGTVTQGSGVPGADMSVEEAWSITRGDSSIKVAILDSGIDTLHPDLKQNLLSGYDATGGGSRGYPNTTYSKDGHGTACAGIVAAVADNGIGVAGVAPNCKLIPVKVFYYVDTITGVIPFSTSQWFADGISWAWQAGEADIMSNSWGVPDILFGLLGGPISLVEDAINQATQQGRNGKGVALLFSSGNDNGEPLWPSSLPITIAVTATSMCDERKSPSSCDGESDWGGNYGNSLDVGAPGVRITTTDMRGQNGFSPGQYTGTFNGTSAACPNAAGVMALILSLRPDYALDAARYVLGNAADTVGGYDYGTIKYAGPWSNELGFGRVNAFKALQLAQTFTGIEISEEQEERDFKIFPNPVVGKKFWVKFETNERSSVKMELFDLSGRLILGHTDGKLPGDDLQPIKLPNGFNSGQYFLRLTVNNKSFTKKLLIISK